jgi:hypothetical protein
MITETAIKKARILTFWHKHGAEATEEAFGVKRRTLFLWQKKLKEGNGKLESLNDKSKEPKKKRRRNWDYRVIEEIKRIRSIYPNLGEEKVYPLLKILCDDLRLKCPKPITIGRIIKDLGGLRIFPKKVSHFGKIKKADRSKILRKPKSFKATHAGHLVAMDTIERFVCGMRRYIITFEDIHTRFCFAWATNSHASKAAEEFFDLCLKIFPRKTDFVLTDNGSEFKKHFSDKLKKLHLIHYHTYPKTPKMNAHIERFNRTLQEEFVDYHNSLLLNINKFNDKLMDYLVFYNTQRVHYAFGNKLSPVQFMLSLNHYKPECKSGWGYTIA